MLGSTGYTQDDIAHAIDLVARGLIKPAIGHRFALAETAAAQRLLEDRSPFGKIVINP